MDKEEQMKHIELVKEFIQKSPEEINEIFNTGMFNEIVLGAIIITMENLNHFNKNDIEELVYECKEGTFDQYTASECRQAYKKL